MNIKLISWLTTSIFLLSSVSVYSAPQQNDLRDQRGFPRAQSGGSQMNMNRQNVQRPNQNIQRTNQNVNQWKQNQNQNMNQWRNKNNQNQWNKNNNWNKNNWNNNWKKHDHHDVKRFYYYNNTIYPYPYFYSYPDYSYPTTYTYPTTDSYYYSTPSDYQSQDTYEVQTSDYGYDVSGLPDGVWAPARGGDVPDRAFVYQVNNGAPIYYCKVQYNYNTYYGVLTPSVGCYVKDGSSIIRFDQYEVLISSGY